MLSKINNIAPSLGDLIKTITIARRKMLNRVVVKNPGIRSNSPAPAQ